MAHVADEWITTGEAARLLGVRSINTVKRLIALGQLGATRPGGSHFRVRRSDVELLASESRGVPPSDPRSLPRSAFAEWAERHRVRRLAMFGSTARGEARPDSDVDLVMELQPDAGVGLFEQVEMTGELQELLGRPIDLGDLGPRSSRG